MRTFTTMTAIATLIAPGLAEAKGPATPAFEVLRYRLPATQIVSHLSLTLESCATLPVVSGTATLEAKAAAGAQFFTITDADLKSARIKRELAVTMHDTGTIATIDSKVEDRTGAIIGNIFKTIGSVLAIAALNFNGGKSTQTGTSSVCSKDVQNALSQVALLSKQINDLNTNLAALTPKDPPEMRAKLAGAIKVLAANRAALRAGVLHVDLDQPLDLKTTGTEDKGDDKHPYSLGGTTAVDMSALLDAWIDQTKAAQLKSALGIGLEWAALPASIQFDPRNEVNKGLLPDAGCSAGQSNSKSARPICLVTPEPARFGVHAVLTGLTSTVGTAAFDAEIAAPMGQWGKVRLLGLGAGFGEGRELALTLDKFGRTSQAKWSSDARSENVTGAIAGAAGQLAGIVQANSTVARQKAEIEALTTQQTLNRMRACQEILAAGGSECPAEAPVAN